MLTAALIVLVGLALLLKLGVAADILELRRTRGPLEQSQDSTNVKDYGAVGDGSSDDTAAFLAAAKAAAGGYLVIPEPDVAYVISGSVPIQSGTTVIGLGMPKIIQNNDDINIFDLSDASDVHIEGIHFDGNGKGTTLGAYTNCAVMSHDTSNDQRKDCSVRRCRFVGFKSWCVSFAGNGGGASGYAYGVTIADNIISDQVDEAINVYYVKRARIAGNRITNHAKEAIKATTADEVSIESNRIYAAGIGATDGPLINVGTDCSRIQIIGNYTFQGNKGIGVEKRVTDLIIQGNICEAPLQEGIGVVSTAGDGTPMARVTVIGNQCLDCGGYGMVIQGLVGMEAEDVTVNGNTVRNNGTASTSPGIQVYRTRDATVSGNVVDTSSKEGIIVSTVRYATVANNRVFSSQQHGIRLVSVLYGQVMGNQVIDANRIAGAYHGIYAEASCGSVSIAFNTCVAPTSNQQNGVNNASATDAWAACNTIDNVTGNQVQLSGGGVQDGYLYADQLGIGNSAAATTPAAVTKKIQVYDKAGASLGYLAVYGSIS